MAVVVWACGALHGQKRRFRARAVAVYSVEGGASTVDRSWFHAEVQGRDFWETYMPAFHACVVKARLDEGLHHISLILVYMENPYESDTY